MDRRANLVLEACNTREPLGGFPARHACALDVQSRPPANVFPLVAHEIGLISYTSGFL